jgi:diguanylate cyclase (GGDEF)-like protein
VKRLFAVLSAFVLLGPLWATDIKSVPEIRTDLNPTGQNAVPQVGQAGVSNIGIPSAVLPQAGQTATPGIPTLPANAQVAEIAPASPSVALSVVPGVAAAAKLEPIASPTGEINQPQAQAESGPPNVESEKTAGDVQFDRASRITQSRPVEGTLWIKPTSFVERRGASRLAPSTPRTAAAPAGVGGDGESADRMLEQTLDRAVAKGQLSAELRQELLDAAFKDPLTGLHNRLYLDSNLPDIARLYPSLTTFKLDALKEINDSYDHATGNNFLTALAAVTGKVVGQDGLLVRRSPTGFALFMDAPESDARLAAEALRLAVSREMGDPKTLLGQTAARDGVTGTISLGVAALKPEASPTQSYRDAFGSAEKARALAKEMGGGDRVAYDDGDSKMMDRRTLEEAVAALKRSRKPGMGTRLAEVAQEGLTRIMQERDSTVPTPQQMSELMDKLKDPEVRAAAFGVIYQDRLTGLRNRRYLFDNLNELMGGYATYMALDLDKFGDLNAVLGEDTADLVLKEFGVLLAEAVKNRDAMALHLSGEEFVILSGRKEADPAAFGDSVRAKVKEELGARVAAKYGIRDQETGAPYAITISIGVAPIKDDVAAPDRRLALVTAMAESLLQRAKANGRDRVEGGSPSVGAADLTALLARVVRVDAAVRQVVERIFPAPPRSAPGEAFFDNSFKSRREVLRELKYNPASQRRTLLSDPEKGGSETSLISPEGQKERIMKISNKEVISNELFIRGVLENFELFNQNLTSPRSVAYERVWPFEPVMVQDRVANAHKSWMGANLPMAQRVALAILAGTFGVHGFNWGAYLDTNWTRSVLVDFEFSRAEAEVSDGPLPVGAASFHPWVSTDYYNDLRDFQPALAAWKQTFSKPETQAEIARLERRAGIGEKRIAADLKLFQDNLALLEKSLERDVAMGNNDFQSHAKRAGLTGVQTETLSVVNKNAHRSPAGGILRDMARWLIRQQADRKPAFVLSPEEWRRLCDSRRQGLLPDDRKALLKAASQGRVTAPPDSKPYSVAEVHTALDRLAYLLKP